MAEIESDRLPAQRLQNGMEAWSLKAQERLSPLNTTLLAIIDAGKCGDGERRMAMSRPASSAHCLDRSLPRSDAACVGCGSRRGGGGLYWQRVTWRSRHVGDRSFTTLRRIVPTLM
ncbi:hypothetical protein KCP78_22250 [Salmonella enterica subsp. enterica]|nr:hypothetical protein KCP78_22250 [Salmonella enterica subsp. enterica]